MVHLTTGPTRPCERHVVYQRFLAFLVLGDIIEHFNNGATLIHMSHVL